MVVVAELTAAVVVAAQVGPEGAAGAAAAWFFLRQWPSGKDAIRTATDMYRQFHPAAVEGLSSVLRRGDLAAMRMLLTHETFLKELAERHSVLRFLKPFLDWLRLRAHTFGID